MSGLELDPDWKPRVSGFQTLLEDLSELFICLVQSTANVAERAGSHARGHGIRQVEIGNLVLEWLLCGWPVRSRLKSGECFALNLQEKLCRLDIRLLGNRPTRNHYTGRSTLQLRREPLQRD